VELNHQSTRQKLGQLQFGMFSIQHPEKDKEVTQRRNSIVTLCWRHQYPCHAIAAGGSAEVRYKQYELNRSLTLLGRAARKPVNAIPGLKVNRPEVIIFLE